MYTAAPEKETRWTGTREVMTMAGPIVISALSFVAMDFADKLMVAQLGTENLAAIGSASIWAYVLSTVILGVVGCVSTFVSQSIGRGDPERNDDQSRSERDGASQEEWDLPIDEPLHHHLTGEGPDRGRCES